MEIVDFASVEGTRDLIVQTLANLSLNSSYMFTLANIFWQNLRNYQHVGDIIVDIIDYSLEQYDVTNLGDEMVRYVSSEQWADASDKLAQKYIGKFLVDLTIKTPKIVTKFMNQLILLLGNESYIIRTTIIEVLGHLIIYNGSIEQSEQTRNQVIEYFHIIEQRFLDSHYIVRGRVLQVCQQICMGRAKFPKQRPRLVDLTIDRLEDKASNVRRNAIKALSVYLETHPFNIDGGELYLPELEDKMQKAATKLQAIIEKAKNELEIAKGDEKNNSDSSVFDEPSPIVEAGPSENETNVALKYKFEMQYYQDATQFVRQLETATKLIVQLLLSTNRQEVIDSIKFIVQTSRYKISGSEKAIKKMLHLVWQPVYANVSVLGNQDNPTMEHRVMQTLYDAFVQLYISPLDNLSGKENVSRVCKNLLSLVNDATLSDLVSLEKILQVLLKTNNISPMVIATFKSLFSKSSKERRGSILILRMLAPASKTVVSDDIDLYLSIGLGKIGLADYYISEQTCQALCSITKFNNNKRLEMSNIMIEKFKNVILTPTNDPNCNKFPAALRALDAIYALGDQPSQLASEIAKSLTKSSIQPLDSEIEVSEDFRLGQLLAIVGHIAIKEIELLEVIEADIKRRKAQEKPTDATTAELMAVEGQGNDDEIGDLISSIKEKQILYGPKSLLKLYTPLIERICTQINENSNDSLSKLTKTWAIVALCKFMCVSFEYCEKNLPLLLSLLKKSPSHIDRANISIALGDLSICFNRLIGENLGYLYDQLTSDTEIQVRRTMLMVLIHLILNGMIKIKSHLGKLAICLEDNDILISQLTKLFFQELSSKNDNVIYNNIPDIISTLSFTSGKEPLEQQKFDKIARYLFRFIKDKQSDNIVEKLCLRFKSVQLPRQAYDLTFCLSLLSYKNDKPVYKLISLMPLYSQYLAESNVYKLFTEIVTKVKHNTSGPNGIIGAVSSTVAAELENKLKIARSKALGNSEDMEIEEDESDSEIQDEENLDEIYSEEE
ncbi:hypothetical protein BB560_002931 [Smittium megazygosporum]|uniref:Condensin complex subunit 1 C-terminal domain-containing protein n=1 Tax=Smittium megazygosporum TaxID=133381 RepID=A0A2T9ZDD9_9FUNG|nr:hypothetical protein BB560_002931 [Smittium megazygosporum]